MDKIEDFQRIKRLPPYVFSVVNQLKTQARQQGKDIIDFGMGNPDIETPSHIVDKLVEVARRPNTKRYSQSIGIPRLRAAICQRYQQKYNVDLDPATEAITTIGSKEGLTSLAKAISGAGDMILVPNPCYPIHTYGFILAGAQIRFVPLPKPDDPESDSLFFNQLKEAIATTAPKPLALVVNFPSNPTTQCTSQAFFEELIAIAKHYGIWVIHDFAYGDITFDDYKSPSILSVKGAKDIAVETYSMSKSFSMAGWRVGFTLGNSQLIAAMAKVKSYIDYGTFTPIQVAAIAALEGPQECVVDAAMTYQRRRDVLCEGLGSIGWHVTPPKASMFVWAEMPKEYHAIGSLEFSKKMVQEAGVAAAPGIGFGSEGENFIRFGLIENKQRIRQAVRGLRAMFIADGILQK